MRTYAVTLGVFLVISALPLAVSAQIVPCNGPDCSWSSLIELAKRILDFMITISIIIAALMFAYAGWLFFSDSGNSSNVQQGKKVFGAVVIGLVIVLTAWLVVNTIIDVLTGKGLDERSSQVSNDTGLKNLPNNF